MADSTKFTEPPIQEVVLDLRNVCCKEFSTEAVKLRDVSLEVRQGDLILIHLRRRQNPRAVSSLIQGLSFPATGEVVFRNQRWDDANIEQHFRMRSRIGRVFDKCAWINNLNVTENVTLRPEHHAFPAAKLQQQIDWWSRRLRVPVLSRERPAFVDAATLQKYQWLRAMIGDPSLVILERPMRTLDADMVESLVDGVNEIRKQSAAVVWFTGSEYESTQNFSGRVFHYESKDGKLIPIDSNKVSRSAKHGDSV